MRMTALISMECRLDVTAMGDAVVVQVQADGRQIFDKYISSIPRANIGSVHGFLYGIFSLSMKRSSYSKFPLNRVLRYRGFTEQSAFVHQVFTDT